MQRQQATMRLGPLLAVGALLAVAAAGLGARTEALLSTAGPLRAAGTGILIAVSAALAVAAGTFAVIFLASLRHRRGSDGAPPHVWEPPGTAWGRGLAVLFAGAALAAPWLIASWLTRHPAALARPVPATAPPAVPPATAGPPDVSGGGGWVPWSTLALAAVAVLLVAALAHRHRWTSAHVDAPADSALAAAVEAGRGAVTADGSDRSDPSAPRAAILRCYAAMERALEQSGRATPRPADTPTEVLDRAARAGLVRPRPAGRLVALFSEARFSRHAMTDADRTRATRALDEVLADLGSRP